MPRNVAATAAAPELIDCYMSAIMPRNVHEVEALLTKCRARGVLPSISAWQQGKELPKFHRWHITQQERLYEHLRAAWPDDRPRVMVDLGCHASHGSFQNISDALLWLHHFNASGSLVVAVDIVEDFVLDMQYRFDKVWPYTELHGVEKRALHRQIRPVVGNHQGTPMWPWSCVRHWGRVERIKNSTDHYCRITRQRLGLSSSTLPIPATSYPTWWRQTLEKWPVNSSTKLPTATVRAGRIDDMIWREAPIHGRHIDVLKVDVDLSWRKLGIENLISKRAFSVMVIEIDDTSSFHYNNGLMLAMARHGMSSNISVADQLIWLCHRAGYASFLKVPCCARTRDGLEWASPRRIDQKYSTWYMPLASPDHPYAPTGISMKTMGFVQDLLIVDASDKLVLESLQTHGRASCHNEWCCSKKHSRRSCDAVEASLTLNGERGRRILERR